MKNSGTQRKLAAADQKAVLATLESRFEKNMSRHPGIEWEKVKAKLNANPSKLWSLNEMEDTGGEPDVTGYDAKSGEYVCFDCSPETPKGRVSLCYDREGYDSRKDHHPKDTVVDMAEAMGIEVFTEEQYVELQRIGNSDMKTSCWVKTPAATRKLGGALYCELRYGRVFTGHNGAQSYHGVRGFRGWLRV